MLKAATAARTWRGRGEQSHQSRGSTLQRLINRDPGARTRVRGTLRWPRPSINKSTRSSPKTGNEARKSKSINERAAGQGPARTATRTAAASTCDKYHL